MRQPVARPNELISRSPILIIDDNVENLKLLERMLEWAGFVNTRCTSNGREGLAELDRFNPHLIILDLMMPFMDGYQFLEEVRTNSAGGSILPILVFTADLTLDAKIRALELGASDFLTKPGDAIEIQLRVQNFLKARQMHIELQSHNELLEAKVRQRTEHLAIARKEAVEVLSMASDYRDDNTGQHSHRVGGMSAAIARELGLDADFVENLRLVAPLHDVGKIAIPDYILRKPEALDDEEFAVIKNHVTIGGELLGGKTSPLLHLAREVALYHHEWWNGQGYAAGLAGEDIPLSARIVAVADAFDAMTYDRPYRLGRSPEMALNELVAMAGIQFDPEAVSAIQRLLTTSIAELRQAA